LLILKKIETNFTLAKCSGAYLRQTGVQGQDLDLYFLLKCAFWIGLVLYLLPWPETKPASRTGAPAAAAASPRGEKPGGRTRSDDVLPGLAQTARDGVASAARDYCAEHVADCLSAVFPKEGRPRR
jgi:hypothetical protein